MGKKEKSDGKARVEALEARLIRLEAVLAGGRPAAAEPGALTTEAEGAAPAGRLRLELRADGQAWRQDTAVNTLLSADWPGCAARLAALGHPLRLAILRLAIDGPVSATELQAGMATGNARPSSGQLYHHLRELTATGWLAAQGRGRYALPEGRLGPLLAALALARTDQAASSVM